MSNSDPDPDVHLAQRLAYIHRTLELIAFLLAVLVAGSGTVGLLVGGSAALLLAGHAVSRALE